MPGFSTTPALRKTMIMPEDLHDEEPEDSDEVLLAFSDARAAAPGDKRLLREWAARYPALADEIITIDYAQFAAGMTLTDALEDGPEDPAVAALGADILAARRQARAEKPPLTSLLAEAQARGMDGPQLATVLRLDRMIVARLEQGALDAATVPLALVRQIGAVLERSADDVATFLRGGPRLAASAHYRSRRAPSVSAPASSAPLSSPAPSAMSFEQAVAGSRNLSADDKAYWQAEVGVGVLGN